MQPTKPIPVAGGAESRFARRVFLAAVIWGAISLLPLPFLKSQIEAGVPIGHPEYFYGFIGVCIAFQLVFFVIARDPVRYRPLMLCAVAEKALFVVPVLALVQAGLAPASLLVFAAADTLLLLLFAWAYVRTAAAPLAGDAAWAIRQ